MASIKPRSASEIWQAALGKIELVIPRPSYETWMRGSEGISFARGELVVCVKDVFTSQYLKERLGGIIETALRDIVGDETHATYVVEKASSNITNSDKDHPQTQSQYTGYKKISAQGNTPSQVNQHYNNLSHLSLNDSYTFEHFVVGDSNQLAYAGAKAAAEMPGQTFNPLVLYSGVGLGKTHLLHAIGHEIQAQGMHCIYTTCEEFTNQYVKAIQDGKTTLFRDTYRSADVLLVDDIQFLIGKEQTQEGFFHTFNALHMANKQIVITSDRPVKALKVLESRMTSRLSGGLVADIQPPPLETRLAILQSKAQRIRCKLPREIVEFLAQRIQSNVRELEGNLNRVAAWSQFRNGEITLESVKDLISESTETAYGNRITDKAVVTAVSEHFKISADQILGKSRRKMTVLSRQVAMYLLREETDLSLSAIGKLIGNRDHSTVLHGHERISARIDLDNELRREVLQIRHSLINGK